jgi:hypothetical protein
VKDNTITPVSAPERPTLTLGRPRMLVRGAAVKVPRGTSANINERFWMVWGEGRRNPRQRHSSESAAVTEAERLASLNPGVVFGVYEARRVARRLK